MPAIVVKRGSKWVVLSHKGAGAKTLGTHPDKASAAAQQRAVNASLSKKGEI
jgi:hypothetical protein